ncbi:polysaccharide biosynthesis protein [candidate division CSSED10-310 bacterium]|uniref:Polysaccharide biosynthesis protein n=1 Tax=candidate division CSSED10-310 bacterium TaxID=2855610 RepID=A0ABV6Z3N6_UNCC1
MTVKALLQPTRTKRIVFFLTGDIMLLTIALASAFCIRFEFSFPDQFIPIFTGWLPVILCVKILLFHFFRLYSFTWTFIGIKELVSIGNACFFSSAVIYLLNMLTFQMLHRGVFMPRSVILIDFILSLLLIGNFRVSKRLYYEALKKQQVGKRTLIIGAGPTGERLVREFLRSDEIRFMPVAFVDDDPNKLGARIHGVKVVGNTADIPRVVAQTGAKMAIIAITTAKHSLIHRLFTILSDCGIKDIKVFPHLNQLPTRSISIKDIHDIKLEDLLYRDAVETDLDLIRKFLQNKIILVTGAAGSIGSEIVRQSLLYHPAKVIVFDIDETEVYNLMLQIKPRARVSTEVVPFIGDVRQARTLEKLFSTHKPQVVFHAAAYKHVPMMELFPQEALDTNFLGTYNLANHAVKCKVDSFVNISTDKAVNPSSVMGATKRLAEMVCSTLDRRNGTRFVSVRFGNVLGSRGSVVPLFLEQIRKGGPVTVTHPEVERYFMTIPEAVSLVFQASAMGNGGEVYVLDMGEPVRIIKIAEDLIKLNGMEPYTDVNIEFVGLRPGEKMFEELLTAEEGTTSTEHHKIFVARNNSQFNEAELNDFVSKTQSMFVNGNQNIRSFLSEHVPFCQLKK